MPYRAAIRWLTTGKTTPPVIQYMLLDSNLDYLIYPKQIPVTHLKSNLKEIFAHIETYSSSTIPLIVNYKSINKYFGMHRKDSGKFHYLIKKMLAKRNLLKPNSRTAFLLKKNDLKLFKDALFLLDIDCKSRGNAFIAHLWVIALKATRSRIPLVIKQIWKARCSIKRMREQDINNFLEFYSHVSP